MIAALWGRLGGYVAAVGAALAVLGAAFLRGRKAGTDAAAQRQAEATAKQARERANADRDAARADDPMRELRRDWQRR